MESKHVTCHMFQGCAFCTWVSVGDARFGRYKPTKKPKFWRFHYLSWPNCITVGVNSNRNRLPLGPLLYSYNRQQLITTMSTRERLQRDRATPEMNCWDDMRRFNVTRKGATGPRTQCNRLVLLTTVEWYQLKLTATVAVTVVIFTIILYAFLFCGK